MTEDEFLVNLKQEGEDMTPHNTRMVQERIKDFTPQEKIEVAAAFEYGVAKGFQTMLQIEAKRGKNATYKEKLEANLHRIFASVKTKEVVKVEQA